MAQVYAVVVAIEKYAAGDLYDAPGLVQEAREFVKWLTDNGVPAANIYPLISPLEGSAGIFTQAEFPNLRGADRSDIEKVFVTELQARSPQPDDILYVHWSGHGMMPGGVGQERHLLTADAQSNNLHALNLPILERYLRSKLYKSWSKQMLFIDACSSITKDQYFNSFSLPPLLDQVADAARQQSIVYATPPAWRARNVDGGVLSKRVLAALQNWSPQQLPDAVSEFYDQLLMSYDADRRAGESVPEMLIVNGINGKTNREETREVSPFLYLMIKLVQGSKTANTFSYSVQAWLYDGSLQPLPLQSPTGEMDGLWSKEKLPLALLDLYAMASQRSEEEERPLLVEFLIPYQQMHDCVEEWKLLGSTSRSLGSECPLVVRSLERSTLLPMRKSDSVKQLSQSRQTELSKQILYQKWLNERYTKHRHRMKEIIAHMVESQMCWSSLVFAPPPHCKSLGEECADMDAYLFLLLNAPPFPLEKESEQNIFLEIMLSGFPFAVWSRGQNLSEEELLILLGEKTFENLPYSIHEARKALKKTHPASQRGVALLWDEPARQLIPFELGIASVSDKA